MAAIAMISMFGCVADSERGDTGDGEGIGSDANGQGSIQQMQAVQDTLAAGEGPPSPIFVIVPDKCRALDLAASDIIADVTGTASPASVELEDDQAKSLVAEATLYRAAASLCLGRPASAGPDLAIASELKQDLSEESRLLIDSLDSSNLPSNASEWQTFVQEHAGLFGIPSESTEPSTESEPSPSATSSVSPSASA